MNGITARKRLSRQEAQVQTRERLVDSARELFVRNGFGGTSLRDIAEEAGFSQGAFYSNFPSKEAVLLELLKRQVALEHDRLEAILGNPEQSAEQVLATLGEWLERVEWDREWSILAIELQLHALRSPTFAESYARFWSEHEQRAADLVSQTFARCGKVTPDDPAQLAAGLMALANGLAVQEGAKRVPRIATTLRLFLEALIGAAPPDPNAADG